MVCVRGKEIGVYQSPAGWYQGTYEEGCPFCRLTSYASSEEKAKKLPLSRQSALENSFCNGCGSCIVERA